jgi:glycerol 2-dehydrogenase (NADP+)
LVKCIGVSNFNIYRLKELLAAAKYPPVASECSDLTVVLKADPSPDQVELSIQNPQFEFVTWMKGHGIQPQAFSPLGGMGGQHLRQHPTVLEIGKKHGVHGAVVLISWLLKRGIQPLPKSVFENEIQANIARKQTNQYVYHLG